MRGHLFHLPHQRKPGHRPSESAAGTQERDSSRQAREPIQAGTGFTGENDPVEFTGNRPDGGEIRRIQSQRDHEFSGHCRRSQHLACHTDSGLLNRACRAEELHETPDSKGSAPGSKFGRGRVLCVKGRTSASCATATNYADRNRYHTSPDAPKWFKIKKFCATKHKFRSGMVLL